MNFLFFVTIFFSFALFAHEEKLESIDVVEREETQGLVDFVPSVTKLKGKELIKKRQTSIGDTLGTEAGVQSTSFGPNASRPVIRGLDGDRIRVLQNGLGTIDASTQSLDHAIPVDTLTIDQMEIVRGPMSLLYGSSAVGGVVNLVTNRIHYEFMEGFFSKFLLMGETVNNGLSSAAHLNYGKNNWIFHLDGSTRNLGDVEIPGYAHSEKLRKTNPTSPEPKDKLPNSFNKQNNIALAASRIFNRGYYGVSYNHFNTLYGTVADEEVSIDMTQNRLEFHAEMRPEYGGIRKWKIKSAQSDYFHTELEGNVSGTKFTNRGNETRVEALNKSGDWNGVSGFHSQVFDFSAKGEEAFLPSSENIKLSAFSFQQLSLGKNAIRFGGRIENSSIKKNSSEKFGSSDDKGYLGYNASIGHCYDFSKKNTLESSFSLTERAPTFQELYSDGEHIATGTYEVGDSTIKKEKATAFEVTYKNNTEKNNLTMSIYSQVFNDYISLNPTGDEVSGVPEYNYEQVNALFYGLDLDNKSQLIESKTGVFYLLNKLDFVRAKNTDDGTNLPRISPPRFTVGFEFTNDKWSADIESIYVAHQTKIAPEETRTDDYIYTNVGYTYRLVGNSSSIDLFARVRNVFDVEARNHVSTLKEIAPLPGRNFIFGGQVQF